MPYTDNDELVGEQVEAIPQESATTRTGIFLFLLAGTMLAPLLPNQLISGPIVNALLIIITVMLGWRSGILMSFVPSLMAAVGGLLPPMLWPFIPFIMASNVIFVTLINYFRLKNYWLASGVASIAKFIFLAVSSQLFFSLFLHQTMAKPIAFMMSWYQLISAAAGCLIAYTFLKIIKRI